MQHSYDEEIQALSYGQHSEYGVMRTVWIGKGDSAEPLGARPWRVTPKGAERVLVFEDGSVPIEDVWCRKLNYVGEHRFSGNGRRWWRHGGSMPDRFLGEHINKPSWHYRERYLNERRRFEI